MPNPHKRPPRRHAGDMGGRRETHFESPARFSGCADNVRGRLAHSGLVQRHPQQAALNEGTRRSDRGASHLGGAPFHSLVQHACATRRGRGSRARPPLRLRPRRRGPGSHRPGGALWPCGRRSAVLPQPPLAGDGKAFSRSRGGVPSSIRLAPQRSAPRTDLLRIANSRPTRSPC